VIFNDGAFDPLKQYGFIELRHGEPITFGPDGSLGVIADGSGAVRIAPVAEVGIENVLRHDAHEENPQLAFALSRLTDSQGMATAPIGIFRDVDHPAYDDLARAQVHVPADAAEQLRLAQELVTGKDTWTV
jgi:2-oxoglutarate ferredoxin oxidoreductase subunit beta